MKNSRFRLRAAIVGYTVAVAFAFNGLLSSVIDASLAAGGSPFAILCLSSDGSSPLPGQRDNAAKCSCTLSCCCASGDLKRTSHENDLLRPAATTALAQAGSAQAARNFLADAMHHLRSPPVSMTT